MTNPSNISNSSPVEAQAEPERAAFEAWADTQGFNVHRDGTEKYCDYHRATTRWAWMAWQARAALAPAQPAQAQVLTDAQLRDIWVREKGGVSFFNAMRAMRAALAAAGAPAQAPQPRVLSDQQIDALDTYNLSAAWPNGRQRARDFARDVIHAAPDASSLAVMDMALCERHSLVLRVGQPYIFRPVGECENCAAMVEQAREAYGPSLGAPESLARHAVSATPTLDAMEAAQAPPAVEPAEGNLPSRVWLNDMGTTQKLSFEPMAGASEHFEYVPFAAPQPQAAQPVPAQVVGEPADFSEFEKAALLLAGMVQEYDEFAGGGLFFDKAKAVFDAIAATPPTQAAADVRDGRRYRWLRENRIDWEPPGWNGLDKGRHDMRWFTEIRDLDAAIDTELNRAAMTTTPRQPAQEQK